MAFIGINFAKKIRNRIFCTTDETMNVPIYIFTREECHRQRENCCMSGTCFLRKGRHFTWSWVCPRTNTGFQVK